jgi:hypothetical protein
MMMMMMKNKYFKCTILETLSQTSGNICIDLSIAHIGPEHRFVC